MPDNPLSNERLSWMFTQMLRIREFEERVKRTFEEHPLLVPAQFISTVHDASPTRDLSRTLQQPGHARAAAERGTGD